MSPRKRKPLTNEEVADNFIHFGNNLAFFGFMEVVYTADRLMQDLNSKANTDGLASESAKYDELAGLLLIQSGRMREMIGMRNLIAASVKRWAFMTGAWGDGDDLDPDNERSLAVTAMLLTHARKQNDKQDEPLPGDEEEEEK